MGKTKTVVNSDVVVQIVPAPKAEFIVDLNTAGKIDQVLDRFCEAEDHAFEADLGMEKSAMMMADVMGTAPTYVEWMAKAKLWQSKYMARKPNANEESAERAFQRLAKRMEKEVGLTKPSSKGADAVRKAGKREQEKKELMSMVDSQLEQMLAAYKAEDEFTKASKVKAELKRRADEANKDQLEIAKQMRADVVKRIKLVTDTRLLGTILDMLPELPAEDAEV